MTYRQCMFQAHEELGRSEEEASSRVAYADSQHPESSDITKATVPDHLKRQMIDAMKEQLTTKDDTKLTEIILMMLNHD